MPQKWAKEPWKVAEGQFFIKEEEGWGSIQNAADWFIAKLEDSLDPPANAHRIVACVNACTGLEPTGLPEALAALRDAEALLRRLAGAGGPAAAEAAPLAARLAKAIEGTRLA